MEDNVVVIKFADSKVPVFKETPGKDFVWYGHDNKYPNYLLHLYNKSAKHNAIINGKVTYIAGNGVKAKVPTPSSVAFETRVNRTGETLNSLMLKTCLDIELYGGFRWQIIPNLMGTRSEVYHVDFNKIRTGKDKETFYYKKEWTNSDNRETAIPYPSFYPGTREASIFAYNEYRPGTDIYPLPGYLGANNYIETDIEISKYNLSAITNGMVPSKMIQFFIGDPGDEGKKEVERDVSKKFSGSENAGKFFLIFNKNKDQEVKIDDISGTELDKQFDLLNKTCQQEIFSGHQITSGLLFGIKEPGQLGGTSEIQVAHDIFKNTYVNSKQKNLEDQLNYVCRGIGVDAQWELQHVDPIGLTLDNASLLKIAPIAYLQEKMNIDPAKYPGPVADSGTSGAPTGAFDGVNDHIKNLTGRNHQNIERIKRKYQKGALTREAAAMMLKNGFGFSDDDVEILLADEQQFSSEEEVADMFDSVGDKRKEFIIIHSKPVKFESDEGMVSFERQFYKQRFATSSVTDKAIVDILNKTPNATPAEIARLLTTTEDSIIGRLADLEDKGVIKTSPGGTRSVIKPPTGDNIPPTSVQIRYSYEVKPGVGPAVISTTRPFCKKLIELDKVYSRAEIEQISQRVGYSVFDRAGGFWNHNGKTEDSCRHQWRANIVIKKR